MRDSTNNGAGGILDPVWRVLDQALAVAQNRLELFRLEAQEEKIRMLEIILLACAVIVLSTLALAAGTFAVALIVWRSDSMATLGCLVAAYVLGAGAAGRRLWLCLKTPPPFSGTAEEIRKDRACIPR